MIESVPVIITLAADLYLALHSKSIREQFPDTKIWEYEWTHDGKPFSLKMNGAGENNGGLTPFGMHVFGNGWPIFCGDPAGGCLALIPEQELIDVLQAEISRLKAAVN